MSIFSSRDLAGAKLALPQLFRELLDKIDQGLAQESSFALPNELEVERQKGIPSHYAQHAFVDRTSRYPSLESGRRAFEQEQFLRGSRRPLKTKVR
jgi:hypothetical protein